MKIDGDEMEIVSMVLDGMAPLDVARCGLRNRCNSSLSWNQV